jgi:hypothetical protein
MIKIKFKQNSNTKQAQKLKWEKIIVKKNTQLAKIQRPAPLPSSF